MKSFVAVTVVALLTALSAQAQTYVQPHVRSDGTFVQGHWRSSPNSTVRDNYSYRNNTNPFTGERGSNSYRNNPTSPYYNPYASGSGNNFGNSLR